MADYVEVMTRERLDGCIDKLALLDALAWQQAANREFCEEVLAIVSPAGNSAAEQASFWCSHVEQLPYRREPIEQFRAPMLTLRDGGDCDDLVLLALSGLRCLAIPCMAEALCDEEGWAFHVRLLVGLPPIRPTSWCIVDPVWQSEAQWAMVDVPASSLPIGRETLAAASQAPATSTPSLSTTVTKLAFAGLCAMAGLRMVR